MSDLEEKFYEIAAQELATKQVAVGLMAKAYSESDGDEKRAVASYIKLRVDQLSLEFTQHQKRTKEIERTNLKRAREEALKRDAAREAQKRKLMETFTYELFLEQYDGEVPLKYFGPSQKKSMFKFWQRKKLATLGIVDESLT
jgi:hypothetical protein